MHRCYLVVDGQLTKKNVILFENLSQSCGNKIIKNFEIIDNNLTIKKRIILKSGNK